MELKGLHLLLTYQCIFECDHCFVWGSPRQCGTMTLAQIKQILEQAKDVKSIEWIFFEGGEPFLYYPTLLKGIQEARQRGFRTGIVTNAYWANSLDDALEALRPFAGLIEDISVSSDLYHYSESMSQQARNAVAAAEKLKIPVGTISVAQPDVVSADCAVGQLPEGESSVMYRGRAACNLVPLAARQPWEKFTTCPHEDLRAPGRCHLDPLGNLHICQGISLGNIYETPLKDICAAYDADAHPICGPLLNGGPVALVTEYTLPHEGTYADACHLCYTARQELRRRFPEILNPDQMYGVPE